MTCGNCHSPKGPPDVVAGKDFSGGLRFNEPPFDVTAPNITPDKETGIGAWSDADIKKLLRTGMRPNGVPVAVVMPTGFYDIITDGDMDAIVAYLRTHQAGQQQSAGSDLPHGGAAPDLSRRREALYARPC